MTINHESFVAAQYDSRAGAYVTSQVHAQGEDLDQLEAFLRGRGIGRLLDLGCGGGHVSYRAAAHVGQVVACDLTASMVDAVATTATARGLANITARQGAAEALPFADGSFDCVATRYSAHHWRNLEAGLREARRMLKPGDPALFIDGIAPGAAYLDTHLQAIELLRDPSHGRNYSLAEWVAALERCGFRLTSVTPRRLHLVFDNWIQRTAPPASHAAAILSLQAGASAAVRAHFGIDEAGSFWLDTVSLTTEAV